MWLARPMVFALWLAVAMLAVAGFAGFSPDASGPGDSSASPSRSAGSDWGTSSGRVVALAFSGGLRTPPVVIDQPSEDALISDLLDERRGAEVPVASPESAPALGTQSLPLPTSSPTAARRTQVARHLSEAEMRGILALFFAQDDIERALEITFCESRWDPAATNPSSGAAGLFQHIPRFWSDRSSAAGWAGADIYDPHANAAVSAWLVYDGGGWIHWAASQACWGS